MRRSSIAVCAALSMIALTPMQAPASAEYQGESIQVRRRKKTTHAKNVAKFYGYASDRKGKGEKKRAASALHSKGWK